MKNRMPWFIKICNCNRNITVWIFATGTEPLICNTFEIKLICTRLIFTNTIFTLIDLNTSSKQFESKKHIRKNRTLVEIIFVTNKRSVPVWKHTKQFESEKILFNTPFSWVWCVWNRSSALEKKTKRTLKHTVCLFEGLRTAPRKSIILFTLPNKYLENVAVKWTNIFLFCCSKCRTNVLVSLEEEKQLSAWWGFHSMFNTKIGFS
jgi:hypothetical protein